jgi:hypothetical protein
MAHPHDLWKPEVEKPRPTAKQLKDREAEQAIRRQSLACGHAEALTAIRRSLSFTFNLGQHRP